VPRNPTFHRHLLWIIFLFQLTSSQTTYHTHVLILSYHLRYVYSNRLVPHFYVNWLLLVEISIGFRSDEVLKLPKFQFHLAVNLRVIAWFIISLFSLSPFPVTPTLEYRASVKRFVSLQFLNPKTIGTIPCTGISPSQGRYLHNNRINTDEHPWIEWDSNPLSQRSSGRRLFIP
jgi:hypothetical protein